MQMHKRDRGPLDLRLRRLVADLRVQSLGLDLRGSMTTEMTPLKRAHELLDDSGSPVCEWAQQIRTCPSPSPSLGPLPTIIA